MKLILILLALWYVTGSLVDTAIMDYMPDHENFERFVLGMLFMIWSEVGFKK